MTASARLSLTAPSMKLRYAELWQMYLMCRLLPLTVTAKRPLSQGRSVLTFSLQKPDTRWGGSGQVSLTVWTHQK